MGRGRDKRIELDDIKTMSPQETSGLLNAVRMGKVKVTGTAVVRKASSGNARYEDRKLAGTYNEDKL
jgi:hypothetical protein